MNGPTCIECERIRRGLDNRPDGEQACGTCGDVWCIMSRSTFGDAIDEQVRERIGPDVFTLARGVPRQGALRAELERQRAERVRST